MTFKEKLLFTLFAIVALAAVIGLSWKLSRVALKYPEPFTPKKLVIEQLIAIQREVDCNMIDGRIGPETKGLVNAQCELDRPEYYNRQAKPYMTKSGAPMQHRIRNPPKYDESMKGKAQ